MTILSVEEALQHINQIQRGKRSDLDIVLRSIVQAEAGAELQYLNGAVAGNAAASKVLVLDSNGDLSSFPGEIELDGNKMATEAGGGITAGSGTLYFSSVIKIGGIIYTSILLDLTGVSSATTDLDIIGTGTTEPAHIGQITAARNGTIVGGRITCLELPASLTDIDLYSATVGAGATTYFEASVSSLVETALLTKGGAWAAGDVTELTSLPAANGYLYLVNGADDTPDVFSAGKFLIELEGYDA